LPKNFFLCEKKIVEKMTDIYCKDHHQIDQGLCRECTDLLNYVHKRLDHCFFGENKPVCGKCPIHCYQKEMREKITIVMRYAGPRMIYKHPILAIDHIFRSLKKVPLLKK
jgi:hypothetical protein